MALPDKQVLTGNNLRDRLSEETVAVYGYGRSGRAVVDELISIGSDVHVFEDNMEEPPNDHENHSVEWSFADHDLELVDRLIVSPGVPADNETIVEARTRGIDVWGEVELAYRLMESGKLWTVTGTNGKSTCVELIGCFLREQQAGEVSVCGNRGTPFIEAVCDDTDYDNYVVEISSFQVEGMDVFQPDAVLLTNLGDDHVDRHGSLEAYHGLKWELVDRVSPEGRVVVPLPEASDRAPATGGCTVLECSSREIWGGEFRAQWRDDGLRLGDERIDANEVPMALRLFPQNLLSVIGLVLDRPDRGIVEGALGRFDPLPHRAEVLGNTGEITVIEDSKATNPDAVRRLLTTVNGPYRLVLGGAGKDAEFTDLFREIDRHEPEQLIFCGDESFVEHLEETADSESVKYDVIDGWEAAVKQLIKRAEEGDTVVLSPGGTSFDAFDDYKDRGEQFQRWVRETVGR